MILTEPTQLEFMKFDGQIFRSIPGWTKKNACYHVDMRRQLNYKEVCIVSYMRRTGNFTDLGNMKPFRMNAGDLGTKPNTYLGRPNNKEAYRLFTEDIVHDKDTLKYLNGNIPLGDDLPHREVIFMRMPSAYAKNDGEFVYSVDDHMLLVHNTWKNEGTGYLDKVTGKTPEFRGLPRRLCLQTCYQDNGTGPLPVDAYVQLFNVKVEIYS